MSTTRLSPLDSHAPSLTTPSSLSRVSPLVQSEYQSVLMPSDSIASVAPGSHPQPSLDILAPPLSVRERPVSARAARLGLHGRGAYRWRNCTPQDSGAGFADPFPRAYQEAAGFGASGLRIGSDLGREGLRLSRNQSAVGRLVAFWIEGVFAGRGFRVPVSTRIYVVGGNIQLEGV